MTPVIPTSINNFLLTPGTSFTTRKSECLKRCNLSRNSTKQTWSSPRGVLPLSTSVRLFPQLRNGFALQQKSRIHLTSATGTDLAVEESDSPVVGEDSGGPSEIPTDAVGTSGESSVKSNASVTPAQNRRSRPARKSEMPPVKPEELVPGATFTGKVRSIQPFGAFVDFGAFTDGLVHVSCLSDTFVKDVNDVVSIGQEVKVRVVEANMETRRISLTMRETDDSSKIQQRKDGPASSETSRPPRKSAPRSGQKRDEVRKSTKLIVGEELEGTVKNLIRSGAFISLPDGEEGFLPASEEVDEGHENIMGGSSLVAGQQVSVRVLRVARGQATLTMKKEDVGATAYHGVIHSATNPFMLAFRKNKDIAAFLDAREKVKEPAESSVIPRTSNEIEGKVSQTESELNEVQDQQTGGIESDRIEEKVKQTGTEIDEVQNQQASSREGLDDSISEDDQTSSKEVDVGVRTAEDASNEIADDNKVPESIVSGLSDGINGVIQSIEEVTEVISEILAPEESVSSSDQLTEEAPAVDKVENFGESDLPGETDDQSSSENQVGNASPENMVSDSLQTLDSVANSIVEKVGVSSEVLSSEGDGSAIEEVSTTDGLSVQIADPIISDSAISKEVTEIPAVDAIAKDEVQIPTPSAGNEILSADSGISKEVAESQADDAVAKGEVQIPMPNAGNEILSATISGQIADPIMSDSGVSKEVAESQADDAIAKDELQIPMPNAGNEILSATIVEDAKVESNTDKNGTITGSNGQIDVPTGQQNTSEENLVSQEVENEIDNIKAKDETLPADSEIPSATLVEDDKVGSVPEKNGTVTNSNGQSGASSQEKTPTKAAISPALVKHLREETGAGMMDCKKALSETGGDLVKAQEFLRKKGLASADKKASRATAEGRIGAYIHDSRIGVLIEVNCETDFVSRGDIFKELVDDLAMQVAACPQVQYLGTEDVPKEFVDKEREIEMQKEDLLSKPEQIRSKIVDGRIRKRLEELALLEQPYIKNDKLVVKDWVKQTIATIGENMKVKRFVRFNLGEGLEKKSQDFAAEVAAQTAAKTVQSPGKEQPAVIDAEETVDAPPKATVSAALVKQLRDETGAGMMDCKKALSETEGDLEKAQEYLRKKGLSAADKKSSRLAAEGRIGSYIHDSRIGVLIEANCETDFVGRSEKFKELVDDLAMQVVACPRVQYVSIEDIPGSIVSKEKELEMQREDLQSKPENIREKIVEGRILKRLGELSLLEQPFIKNDSILVKDLVKQTVSALGENIKVRRFARFTLGETKESAETSG